MEKRYFFLSGLPRAGSTLLAAILSQNPEIHANMTSPVGRLIDSMLISMSSIGAYSTFLTETKRKNMLRALIEGYYIDSEYKCIVDTNRVWCGRINALIEMFPYTKIIVCVRDLPWIIDSFERVIRSNAVTYQKYLYPAESMGNVYARAEYMMSERGTIGKAWGATREAFYGGVKERILFIDYNALVRDPARCIQEVYEYIGIPYFEHKFDEVEFDGGNEFDQVSGSNGLHVIRRVVGYVQRETILPPDLFERYADMAFWMKENGARSVPKVII